MPLRHRYDPALNILYADYSCAFTVEQFEATLIEIVNADDHPANVPTIWDLRSIDITQFDWAFIEDLLAVRDKYPERGDALIAIVAPSDLGFGVFRMYTSRGDALPQSVRVFREHQQAEAWILAKGQ